MEKTYDSIGKGGIVKEGIFVRFPELKPARPNNWGNSNIHYKLLVVAESNYFDDVIETNSKSVFKNPELWYQGDKQHLILIPDSKKNDVDNHKYYKTFNKLCKSMNEVSNGLLNCGAIYEEAMFYNYFLRPATVHGRDKRFEKDCTPIDNEVAGTALCGIIEIDKPDIVIFASGEFAYRKFIEYIKTVGCKINVPNIHIDYVNHPAHPARWWDYKTLNGKHKFERLLREYWIKK